MEKQAPRPPQISNRNYSYNSNKRQCCCDARFMKIAFRQAHFESHEKIEATKTKRLTHLGTIGRIEHLLSIVTRSAQSPRGLNYSVSFMAENNSKHHPRPPAPMTVRSSTNESGINTSKERGIQSYSRRKQRATLPSLGPVRAQMDQGWTFLCIPPSTLQRHGGWKY